MGLGSVAGAAQLTLNWADNSSDETGFRIERKIGTGAYTQIATVAGNATSYVDTTVTAGTTYCYQVRAYNAVGDSAPSNEACGTPTGSTPTTYLLTVTKAGSGSGSVASTPTGITCGTTCSASYTSGAVVTLTASAASGSTFSGWSGACTGTAACTVTMSGTTTAQATFSATTVTPSTGPVAAYGFTEASGTTVADGSGNGHTGTISGATWTSSGRYGSALSFNGTTGWVTINDTALLDLTSALTISAWVYPTSGSGWRTVALKEATGVAAYALYANEGNGRPVGYVNVAGVDYGVAGPSALPLNTWSHLAFTYDGGTLRLFVNGVQVGSQSVAGAGGRDVQRASPAGRQRHLVRVFRRPSRRRSCLRAGAECRRDPI
jgi:hypothetical protein